MIAFCLPIILGVFTLGPNASGALLQTPEQLQNDLIRTQQRVAAIDGAAKRYRKIRKELSGFSAEGGELIAYLRGDNVVKLKATHYGESGRAFEEFYFHEGELIFVSHLVENYNRPLSGKVVSRERNRFYFQNGVLIRWLGQRNKQQPVDSNDFKEKQDEYLESARKFASAAVSSEKVIEAW